MCESATQQSAICSQHVCSGNTCSLTQPLPSTTISSPPRSLEAEGLQFFKRDWRYRCFITSGEADGLEALLGTARRQRAEREAEGERHRELAER